MITPTSVKGVLTASDSAQIAWERTSIVPGQSPLLMVNSLGATMAMWDSAKEPLAQGRQVITHDTRGHGGSSCPDSATSIDRLALDLIELLDELDVDVADICGLSLGGMAAMALAVRAPDRVGRLILSNTSAKLGPVASWQARIDTVTNQGMDAIADAVLARWITPSFYKHEPQTSRQWRSMIAACPPKGYAACCAAIRDMDLTRHIVAIKARTSVISGREDVATPIEHTTLIAGLIPNCAHINIAGAHLPHIENLTPWLAAVHAGLDGAVETQ